MRGASKYGGEVTLASASAGAFFVLYLRTYIVKVIFALQEKKTLIQRHDLVCIVQFVLSSKSAHSPGVGWDPGTLPA